jgi:ArsR family transcriptional regulator
MNKYLNVFKALSDETRLRIVHLLLKAKKELCVCEIVDSLSIPQYNVSKHIKELKIAGLLKERKEAQFVFYSLNNVNDKFYKSILKIVNLIPDEYFKQDDIRLNKTLSFRKYGKPNIKRRSKI